MKIWKTKMFGDNRFNFWGWLISGLAVNGFSLCFFIRAISLGAWQTSEGMMLAGIYFVFIGQFNLGLANYMARLSQKLDAPEEAKTPQAR